MIFFSYTKPKMIVADEGKHIRDVNDVYCYEVDEEVVDTQQVKKRKMNTPKK